MPKLAPQRTCIACRQVKGKRELVRLVRVSDNEVDVDLTGRKAGRGTYLCRTPECWDMGLKGNRLGHALRVKLTDETRKQLLESGKEVFKGSVIGDE